jgi:hypothetical protein
MAPSKTAKSHKTDKEQGIFTIPELRVAFDHIEDFLHDSLAQKSEEETIKLLKDEWKKTFHKELDEESAKAYVEHVAEEMKRGHRRNNVRRRRTQRKYRMRVKGGGAQDATAPAMALNGAPTDYVTRPGIYPSQGQTTGYGSVTQYVSSGFNVAVPSQGYKIDQDTNLMDARLYPTAPGQSGTLSLRGGARKRKSRRNKGGGLQQLFNAMSPAPFPQVYSPNNPPGLVQQMQQEFEGRPPLNISSDASVNQISYQMNGKPLMIDPGVTSIRLPLGSVNRN